MKPYYYMSQKPWASVLPDSRNITGINLLLGHWCKSRLNLSSGNTSFPLYQCLPMPTRLRICVKGCHEYGKKLHPLKQCRYRQVASVLMGASMCLCVAGWFLKLHLGQESSMPTLMQRVLLAGKASTVFLEHKGDIICSFAGLMKLSDN